MKRRIASGNKNGITLPKKEVATDTTTTRGRGQKATIVSDVSARNLVCIFFCSFVILGMIIYHYGKLKNKTNDLRSSSSLTTFWSLQQKIEATTAAAAASHDALVGRKYDVGEEKYENPVNNNDGKIEVADSSSFKLQEQKQRKQEGNDEDDNDNSILKLDKSLIRVAYIVSITSCPHMNYSEYDDILDHDGNNDKENVTKFMGPGVVDGPAVLAHSIRRLSTNYTNYTLIALVHPRAEVCTRHFSNPKFGYDERIIRPLGFNVSSIDDHNSYRKYIRYNGCCYEYEFIKLEAYTFIDYDVAFSLDTDILILKPMDDIIDAMTMTPKPEVNEEETTTTGALPPHILHHPSYQYRNTSTNLMNMYKNSAKNKGNLQPYGFLYTRDYIQMSEVTEDRNKFAVQGGFFAIRPSLLLYQKLMETILAGNYQKNKRRNKRRKIRSWPNQYGGYYGAPQVQGLLSYAYGEIPEFASIHHRWLELHPCYYNTMVAFSPHVQPKTDWRLRVAKYREEAQRRKKIQDEIDRKNGKLPPPKRCVYHNNPRTEAENRESLNNCLDCSNMSISELHSTHFTKCYKPWFCPRQKTTSELCIDTHRAWFMIRQELEAKWNTITYYTSGYNYNTTLGYCQGRQKEGYIPIDISHLSKEK